MTDAQKKALRVYRERQAAKGLSRFEVTGRDGDRHLLRALARRLAEDDADAARLRDVVRRTLKLDDPSRGGIYAALRRSPLVGADLDLTRETGEGRAIDL